MRVAYTDDALADLENILSYIAERNSAAAAYVATRIESAVGDIALFPNASRLDPETGVREHVVPGLPVLIIHQLDDDLIEIIAIFHTSRDPANKLTKRSD
jgi:toxin ParE1/3/4